MGKVVYNTCFGGFSLSEKAIRRYAQIKGIKTDDFYDRDLERDDPALIQVIEELGLKAASGRYAKLAIRELKPGTLYRITEYDGAESVETREDVDWKVAK